MSGTAVGTLELVLFISDFFRRDSFTLHMLYYALTWQLISIQHILGRKTKLFLKHLALQPSGQQPLSLSQLNTRLAEARRRTVRLPSKTGHTVGNQFGSLVVESMGMKQVSEVCWLLSIREQLLLETLSISQYVWCQGWNIRVALARMVLRSSRRWRIAGGSLLYLPDPLSHWKAYGGFGSPAVGIQKRLT